MHSESDFETAGLLDTEPGSASDRLALLRWLDELGFTITQMQYANTQSEVGIVELAGNSRLIGGNLVAKAEVLRLSGLSLKAFDEIAEAIGFLPIDAAPSGELGVTENDAKLFAGLGMFSKMFSHEESIAILRVIGSSMARIAEASVSLFLQDIESPHIEAGGSELDHARQIYAAVDLLDKEFSAHLNSILLRHIVQASDRTRKAIAGPEERFDYLYAVGFVDLVGFTTESASMSQRELGTFLREFEERAHNAITSHGARIVKLIGDEVMFVSTDPNAACRAASALMSGFSSARNQVVPRAGLAYGSVLLRGGDYFGSVVNLASRLVDEAVPQEVLVTSELGEAADDCEFAPAGRRMVKGFDEPVRVSSLVAPNVQA